MAKRKAVTRTEVCPECGEEYTYTTVRPRAVCYECANRHMYEAWDQLREKRGPIYEKWLTACRAAMKRQLGGENDARPQSNA